MPKVIEEQQPVGIDKKYDIVPHHVATFVNRARQVSHMGPGLTQFVCPLVVLSKAEVDRFVNEIQRDFPMEQIHVVRGPAGVGIYVLTIDRTYRPPPPPSAEVSPDEEFEAKVKVWVMSHQETVLGWLGKKPTKKT